MGTELATASMASLEQVLIGGDLSKLNPQERVMYYKAVCESVGLNPLTKPFEYITLNGKLTLYARRDATDQLRQINKVSINILSREVVEDCYVVTARATTPIRQDESIGAVSIVGLKGEARANAMMKAETKAKRRVTLSVCGLGMLDETEVDTIPGARITPASGVEATLTQEQHTRVMETVHKVQEWLDSGSVGDAVAEWENANLDAEERITGWTKFDSKSRSAMKRENERQKTEREKAALPAPAKISDAQKKRLEAKISGAKVDRANVKAYIKEQYNIEHFADLTKEQYDTVDAQVDFLSLEGGAKKAESAQQVGLNDSAPLNTQGNAKAHPAIEGENPPASVSAPITEAELLLVKAEEFASLGTERYKAWWLSITEQQRKAIGEARHNSFKQLAAQS